MTVESHQISSNIAQITINRPQVRNALDFNAMSAFKTAVDQAASTPGLRVLILTGAGDKAFCAGGDLNDLASYKTEAEGRLVSEVMTAALQKLEKLPFPTIAAVNGLARGGGAEILMACDLRVMAEDASLGFTQISLAVTPGWGGGQRLLHTVGYSCAMSLLVDAKILTASEALEIGLVNRVVPKKQVLSSAKTWAESIAARPAKAVRGVKQILRAGLERTLSDAQRVEFETFPPLWATDAHQEIVMNFLNRDRGAESS